MVNYLYFVIPVLGLLSIFIPKPDTIVNLQNDTLIENLPKELPSIGNGPIIVLEFYNYECIYCQELFQENQKSIQEAIEQNVITYYPIAVFPDYTPESREQILGSYCAAKVLDVDEFFEYQDYVYVNKIPKKENNQFNECLNNEQKLIEIGTNLFNSLSTASLSGMQSMPTLVTQSQLYIGRHDNYWELILSNNDDGTV